LPRQTIVQYQAYSFTAIAPMRITSTGPTDHSGVRTVVTYWRNGTVCTDPAAGPDVRSTRIVWGGITLLVQPVHAPAARAGDGGPPAEVATTPPARMTPATRARKSVHPWERDADRARLPARASGPGATNA
jgi:hypothetical protein